MALASVLKVSSKEPGEISRSNVQWLVITPMPSMLTPSVASVWPIPVAIAPAATTLQRMPLEA
jgi:hypothetical protein